MGQRLSYALQSRSNRIIAGFLVALLSIVCCLALSAETAYAANVSSSSFSSSKVYTISSASNKNFVLDAAGKSPKIGANISIWTNNGGNNQKWYLIPDGKGYYYIKSASNKTFVLDAAGKTPKIGANISIWKNNGGKNQKWKIEKQKDGTYIIRSASNNKFVLDAAGKSPKIGANVSIWTSNGGKNQKWRITQTSLKKATTTTSKPASNAAPSSSNSSQGYVLNVNSKTMHKPSCASANRISAKNKRVVYGTSKQSLIKQGYTPCKTCKP